jgi:membrane protease YdiL (CAAX protease family)
MLDVTGRRWRGVLVYLALAFGLSWIAQIGLAVWSRNGSADAGLQALGGGILIAALGLMWPPAVGAFVARRWVEGNDFSDAGLRLGPMRYVLLGWLLPPLLVLGAMVLSLPVYPFDSTFGALRQMMSQAGSELPVSAETIVPVQIASGLTVGVLINSVFAFGEEFGWRSYLLPRLIQLLGWWPGVIGHGAIWGSGTRRSSD